MILNENFIYLFFSSSHSSESDVNMEEGLRFQPPNGFIDSREFSEAECDRDLALDLEVQQTLENTSKVNGKVQHDELTSLLAR
jgi:hypothetical protein